MHCLFIRWYTICHVMQQTCQVSICVKSFLLTKLTLEWAHRVSYWANLQCKKKNIHMVTCLQTMHYGKCIEVITYYYCARNILNSHYSLIIQVETHKACCSFIASVVSYDFPIIGTLYQMIWILRKKTLVTYPALCAFCPIRHSLK